MAGILMTREDYEKRKEHLQYLKSTRTLEIAEMLKIARGFGDLSENAEYDAAKDEQAKNEHDIAVLEEELRTAQIIEHSAQSGDKVTIGSKVTVRNTVLDSEMQLEIVGSMAADPAVGKISNESPIGEALLGRLVGDTVPVVTPGGTIHLMIVDIH
ncbi:MAG: transcription elongation factor GreA [Clostridia bacterium]|nr:transcription elongation factor GreA [Clostridia bacterium]